MRRVSPHQVDVGGGGPDVLGGDVTATEAVYLAGERPDQPFRLDPARVADDDRLAPAEPGRGGRGGLGGHGTTEPQGIGEGIALVGLGAEPSAPERRPELGGVDGPQT